MADMSTGLLYKCLECCYCSGEGGSAHSNPVNLCFWDLEEGKRYERTNIINCEIFCAWKHK